MRFEFKNRLATAPAFPETVLRDPGLAVSSQAARTRSMRLPENSSSPELRDFKLRELTMLSITPLIRSIHHWWLERAERHYLICADVEEQRAKEAQMNVAYYQKRAAIARASRY